MKDEDIYGKKNGQKRSYNSYLRVTFISKHSLLKSINSVLQEREIWEMFYLLVGILQNIFISAYFVR